MATMEAALGIDTGLGSKRRTRPLADASEIEDIVRAFPPGTERPSLDLPRHWSNARLAEPDTMVALVLAKPSTDDLARTVAAYGPVRVLEVLERMDRAGDLTREQIDHVSAWLRQVIKGVADVARQFAPR